MRRRLAVVAMCAALCGCETLSESYVADTRNMVDADGVRIDEELMRDVWENESVQYRVFNGAEVPICAFVSLDDGAQASAYSFPGTVRVAPGASAVLGSVTLPARYGVHFRYWEPDEGADCGFPPSD